MTVSFAVTRYNCPPVHLMKLYLNRRAVVDNWPHRITKRKEERKEEEGGGRNGISGIVRINDIMNK